MPELAEMRIPLANLMISDNEGDGGAVMEAGDEGPLAGVYIDLMGMAISSRSQRAGPSTSSRFAPAIACSPWSTRWRSMNVLSPQWKRDPLETCPPGSLTL